MNLIINKISDNDGNQYETPIDALKAFCGYFWVDRTDEESFGQWRGYTRENNLQARILLSEMRKVLDEPPADLMHVLEYDGELNLYHDDQKENTTTPYSLQEGVSWLGTLVDCLALIEKEERNSPLGVLREVLLFFCVNHTEDETIKIWKDYLTKNKEEAAFILNGLAQVSQMRLTGLADLLWKYGMVNLEENENQDEQACQWVEGLMFKFQTCFSQYYG